MAILRRRHSSASRLLLCEGRRGAAVAFVLRSALMLTLALGLS